MSDDDRLAALFRDAASDAGAPPPAFDHDDVLAASHRIGRRRVAMARGALGVLIVAGIGAAVVLPGQFGHNAATTASAPAAGSATGGGAGAAQPESGEGAKAGEAPGAQRDNSLSAAQAPPPVALDAAPAPPSVSSVPAPPLRSDPATTPAPMAAQGHGAPFTGTPLGPGKTDCADRQDPAVRAYLEEALPEVVGAPAAATTMECRAGGERGVSVEVTVDGARGLLSVQYLPPGEARATAPSGARTADARTASGGTVIVSSRPAKAGGPVPFADRLDTTAAYLAPRL